MFIDVNFYLEINQSAIHLFDHSRRRNGNVRTGPDRAGWMLHPRSVNQVMRAVLVSTRPLSADVRHFTFAIPEVESFSFEPGQFVSLFTTLQDQVVTRAYSACGVPDGNRFEIALNLVEGGRFSPHLFQMKPGDSVDVKGPFGTFVWKRPVGDAILVATGTGITPFRGMLRSELARNHQSKISLIFGVRRAENILFRDEFEQMAANYQNFEFIPTLSRADESWTGARGYVQSHVMSRIGERRDVSVYMCGMKAMVDDLRGQLKELGFDRKQIIYEKYD